MTIRARLLVLVTLMTVIPASLVGLIAYNLSKSALKQKVDTQFGMKLQNISMELAFGIGELQKNGEAWTSTLAMADVKISDRDMHIASFLMNVKKSYKLIKDITVVDIKHLPIASTNMAVMLDSDDNKGKAGTNNPFDAFPIDDALKGISSGSLGVDSKENFLLMPIKDVVTKDGTIVGALLIEIEPAVWQGIVAKTMDFQDESNALNIYITGNRNNKIFEIDSPFIHVPFKQFIESGYDFRQEFSEFSGSTLSFAVNTVNLNTVLPILKNPIRITLMQPTEMTYYAVYQLALYLFLVSLFLVIIFVSGGVWFANSIALPIKKLKDVAEDIICSQDLSKRVKIDSADEVGALSSAFNKLLGEIESKQMQLAEYSCGLEAKVAERTKDINALLENLGEGFLTINRNGIVLPGCTRASKEFFGTDPTGKHFASILKMDETESASVCQWIELTFDDLGIMPFNDIKGLGPASFEKINSRFIQLDYKPIFDANKKLEKLICIAADKTQERVLKEQAENEKALVKMVMSILHDRSTFVDFVTETRRMMAEMTKELDKSGAGASLDALFRHMHTIKGGAASFYILTVSRLAHTFESQLAQILSDGGRRFAEFIPVLQKGVKELEAELNNFLAKNEAIVGKMGNVVSTARAINVESIHRMTELISRQVGYESETYKAFVQEFVLEPLAHGFIKFGDVAKRLAEHETKEIDFEILPSDVKVCMEPYRPLLSVFIHAFRNSIDHGIETIDEREQSGKSPKGKIQVAITRKSDGSSIPRILIIVADDGRGIDAKRVLQKATKMGLISEKNAETMKDHDACQFIFANGLSTKEGVSDLSGRGVGLEALKYEATKLGGTAWVESKVGAGTKLYVEIPLYESPIYRSVEISLLQSSKNQEKNTETTTTTALEGNFL